MVPVPLSDIDRRVPRRKIRSDLLHIELENILALGHPGIPIFVSLPQTFASKPEEIGIFEASVYWLLDPTDISEESLQRFRLREEPVMQILLNKPRHGLTSDALISRIPSILNGENPLPLDTLFILTSVELVDFMGCKVQWRLSKARAHMMAHEVNWVMIIYRTDLQKPCV